MIEKLIFKKIEVWVCLLCIFFLLLGAFIFGAAVKSTAVGGDFFGKFGEVAVDIADFPLKTGRILLGIGRPTSDRHSNKPIGMILNNFQKEVEPLPEEYGIPSYSRNDDKVVELVIRDPLSGDVIRSWKVSSEVKAISKFDNSLIIIGERGYQDSTEKLSKVDKDGKVIWEAKIASHHSVFVDARGYIYTPTINLDYSGYPSKLLRSSLPYRDDGFAILSPDGNVELEGSITQILIDNGLIHLITGVGALEWDPIHLNSIKPAPKTTDYYKRGDLLLSARHLSLVFLYRPSSGEIIWYQLGPWTNQHDADFLENGNISVFGNDNVDSYINRTAVDSPLAHGYNNIYVYDFESGHTSKLYEELMRDIGISTVTGGSHKIFANGDLMAHFPNVGLFLLHLVSENKNYFFGLEDNGRLDNLSGHNLGSE